jgi:hypothetical protein
MLDHFHHTVRLLFSLLPCYKILCLSSDHSPTQCSAFSSPDSWQVHVVQLQLALVLEALLVFARVAGALVDFLVSAECFN